MSVPSLTRAAVKLLSFQAKSLFYRIPHRINLQQQQSFVVSENLQNGKKHLYKLKVIKISELVIPRQSLFQNQLSYV